MKKIALGGSDLKVPAIVIGCMRLGQLKRDELNRLVHTALDEGAVYFDHADIYGDGICEEHFGQMLREDPSLDREKMILQSKCGIRKGFFDSSKEYILKSADEILKRLQTEYLDVLLIHRPDALVEPEEVAEAFDMLYTSGKVRSFGVSNHNPMQIELLKKYVRQPLLINQLQFSIPVSNMVASGLEVNMETAGAADRDGGVLDYCRLHELTIQAWSPFQMPNWGGCFLGNEAYGELNQKINELAEKYGVSATAIAVAWILRHPAKMQMIAGTTNPERLKEICRASAVKLTREEWYRLYLAAGHILP